MFHTSEPGKLQKKYATAWKITKDVILDLFVMVMKVNANIAENQEMIDKFQEHVLNYRRGNIYHERMNR